MERSGIHRTEQTRRQEYAHFVRDFSSRINWDALVSYPTEEFSSQDALRNWFDRFDRSFFQITYLRACEYDLVQGSNVDILELDRRRSRLTKFALEMSSHGFLQEVDTLPEHDSAMLFHDETRRERDAAQERIGQTLTATSQQVNRFRDLGVTFGSSMDVRTNNFVSLKSYFSLEDSPIEFMVFDQAYREGIPLSRFAPFDFERDLHVSEIGLDPRFVHAIERYLQQFMFQRQVAGEAPITDPEAQRVRQALIDERVKRQGSYLPAFSTYDSAMNDSTMVMVLPPEQIVTILRTFIPPLELEGILEIVHRHRSIQGIILPNMLVVNTLAHYQDIKPDDGVQSERIHIARGTDDYEKTTTVTAGTNTADHSKVQEGVPVSVLGRRIVRTVIGLENELFISTQLSMEDQIMVRSQFVATLLHEVGEHMLRNLFTIDDMEEWRNITDNGVIPITRYVLNHNRDADGRPAMEAFCESVGMLHENAYILQVVAPEYYTFVTDLLERSMPSWRKAHFRNVLNEQVDRSRAYWQANGYSDEQVRQEYLAQIAA